MRRKKGGDEQGFTLVELLIVIVVLGILAGIVIFALGSTSAQAAVAACNADATSVETAVTAYNVENPSGTATAALLTNTPPVAGALTYLHSMPNSPDYSITLVNGAVMIAAPTSATAVPYGTAGVCDNAGASPTTTTSTAAAAAGGGVTTTSTTAPAPTTTTTTAPVSNGVTVTPSTNTYNGYGGQDILTVSNTSAITTLSITINVAQTTGVSANGGYNSFPGGIAQTSYGLTSTYVLNSNQSIPAASPSGSFAAQYVGTGSARVQTGDTWTVVSKSNGVTSTLSGHF